MSDGESAGRRFWSGILLPFVATRTGLLLAGLVGVRLLVPGIDLQTANLVHHRPAPVAIDIWARWDSEWYLLIAERGYRVDSALAGLPGELGAADATGFFPLYPLAIRALSSTGLPPLVAGLLIANAALLVALMLLDALVRLDFGGRVAGRTIWAFLLFPTSLFFSAVYAESLMVCCALGAILMARRGSRWFAGLLGGLCALTRPTGFLIVIPLLVEFVGGAAPPGGWSAPRRVARIAACIGPPSIALAAYMVYCRTVTGSLVSFLDRQARWRGEVSGPWRAFVRYWESPGLHDPHHSTIDLIFALLLLAAIPVLFRALPRSYALYATASILLPLGSSLWSFARLAAVIFPFHIAVALAGERHPRWFQLYGVLAVPLAAIFMALFAAWRWVG